MTHTQHNRLYNREHTVTQEVNTFMAHQAKVTHELCVESVHVLIIIEIFATQTKSIDTLLENLSY